MLTRSLLLVRDDSFHWTTARAALDTLPAIEIVAEADSLEHAYQLALRLKPDAVLIARSVGGQPALPWLARLRRQLPLTTFAILATDYDAAELLAMQDIGVSSYLLWQGLSDLLLPHILAAATDAQTVILHEAAMRALLTAERVRLTQIESAPEITERERAVLHGLSEGLIVRKIAALLGVTDRTVKRDIAALETKFVASDRFVLGMKAARLGLIP